MSTILSRLIKRVSLSSFTTQTQRSSLGFSSNPSPSRHLHHVKWFHGHFHGVTGIPNDGRVVRLKNSTTGSELYLVGTCHVSKESAETVRKVINSVRPDTVAVELCRKRAMNFLNVITYDNKFYNMYLKSMTAPGGVRMKIARFILNFWYHHLRTRSFSGQEFKVAMEESAKVKARCFAMDQDISVVLHQLWNIISFDVLRRSFSRVQDQYENQYEKLVQCVSYIAGIRNGSYNSLTRSYVRGISGFLREVSPEIIKVLVDDRDKLMFTRLRRMEGKVIVAVVGLGHMDGIEHLWKLAEDDDDNDK